MNKNNSFFIGVIIGLLSINNTYAEENSVPLEKGQPSPYTGVLINTARAQRIQWLQMDYDYVTKLDTLKDKDIQVLNDRVNNLSKVNEALNDKLVTQNNDNTWKLLGMFALGALVTGLVSYGTYRLAR